MKILIKIQNVLFTKMHMKILSVKWRPFCASRDESIVLNGFMILPSCLQLPLCHTVNGWEIVNIHIAE